MLTIRTPQIDAFTDALRERFVSRMVAHVAETYPRQFEEAGETATRALVTDGIEVGRANGVTTEGALATLIELMIEVGPAFERSPDRAWARNILGHPTLPGEAKMERIQQRIRARTEGRVVEAPPRGRP